MLFPATISGAGALGDDATLRLLMPTSEGDIETDLYPGEAPITAGNWLADHGALKGASLYTKGQILPEPVAISMVRRAD